MTEQEQKKELAEQNLLREYPNIDCLCGATRSSILIEMLDRKSQLYDSPSPTIGRINKIYSDKSASERLLKQCITYLYVLKENQPPNETTVRIHASNFFISCRHNTVNQLLCYIAEYPSMKQYSKGFDFTHFSSKFKEYCNEWNDNQNKILEAKYKEEEILANMSVGETGIECLRKYFQGIYMQGVDIKKSPLYGQRKEYAEMIDAIVGDADISDPDETERHYGFERTKEEIKNNRRKLPRWLLSPEEREEFASEDRKPF